ncbi:riboflavin kinase [Rhodofomes roseus]|uniref:Riboflavin kinase n=1 Tax=Rhodofomes roseus TaxID=34475 RepID=A0ABQ8KY90_9APHY|nr:riboflavin kinase [Rhodofomes roseus]KAH9843998.1 riboflavin kinase [Rhodofomes roseus]
MVEVAAQAVIKEERPTAPMRTETFRQTRPDIAGPDAPELPFPIVLSGTVQYGFGRGGKDLGCPTANLPDESITPMSSVTQTGVYYGYAQISPEKNGQFVLSEKDRGVMPMVMSLGWNPFYKNERLTAEIHLMHDFDSDFYGHEMKALVLGYIRPELDYTSREGLVEDIETDKRVALKSLARLAYEKFKSDPIFDTTQPKL